MYLIKIDEQANSLKTLELKLNESRAANCQLSDRVRK